jgi:hypothetical protein
MTSPQKCKGDVCRFLCVSETHETKLMVDVLFKLTCTLFSKYDNLEYYNSPVTSWSLAKGPLFSGCSCHGLHPLCISILIQISELKMKPFHRFNNKSTHVFDSAKAHRVQRRKSKNIIFMYSNELLSTTTEDQCAVLDFCVILLSLQLELQHSWVIDPELLDNPACLPPKIPPERKPIVICQCSLQSMCTALQLLPTCFIKCYVYNTNPSIWQEVDIIQASTFVFLVSSSSP